MPLIDEIFSSGKVSDTVGCLGRNDARSFINVMDEVRRRAPHLRTDRLTPSTSCALIGTDEPQPRTTRPEEMSEINVQNVCQPHHVS